MASYYDYMPEIGEKAEADFDELAYEALLEYREKEWAYEADLADHDQYAEEAA